MKTNNELNYSIKKHTAYIKINRPPNNYFDASLIVKGLKEKYGMIVAGGQDQAKGKIFRITHMGYVDKGDIIAVVAGVEGILSELGHNFVAGAGVAKTTQILDKL